MCTSKPAAAPEIKVPEPKILRNPFLDDARSDSALVSALRTGRSALRIPLNTGLGVGFKGRGGATKSPVGLAPRGNAKVGQTNTGIEINR